jgi:hypothetical protein
MALDELSGYDDLVKKVDKQNKDAKKMLIKKKKKKGGLDIDLKGGLADDKGNYEWLDVVVDNNYKGPDVFDDDHDIEYNDLVNISFLENFEDEDDLCDDNDLEDENRLQEREKEAALLSAAFLVEVILTKERKREGQRIMDIAEEDPMAFLTSQSKEKGVKGVDEVIQQLVNDLKKALAKNLKTPESSPDKHDAVKDISISNLTLMMFFMNRNASVKIPVLYDEELVRLLTETINQSPKGKVLDLLNTLSLLTRIKENLPAYLRYKAVQLFTGLITNKSSKIKNIFLCVVEAMCYLVDDTFCKSTIMKNDGATVITVVVNTAKSFVEVDDFCIRYTTGFLYKV